MLEEFVWQRKCAVLLARGMTIFSFTPPVNVYLHGPECINMYTKCETIRATGRGAHRTVSRRRSHIFQTVGSQ
jgi:hypothetical protein